MYFILSVVNNLIYFLWIHNIIDTKANLKLKPVVNVYDGLNYLSALIIKRIKGKFILFTFCRRNEGRIYISRFRRYYY